MLVGRNKGFPGGSDSKESAFNSGDFRSIAGLGRPPGGGHGNPLQYSCLENPPGQRCLVGYSCKRLGTTERLSRAQHGTGRNNRKIGETELAVERKICRKGRQGKTTIIITSIHYFPGPSSPGYGFSSGHVRK